MFNFERLEVYKDAIKLAIKLYGLTKEFPKDEAFGLISQIRRAAVSISANIAEGSSRSRKDFCHFIDISKGSSYELVALLTIALEMVYITKGQFETTYAEIEYLVKRLNNLKKSIAKANNQ